MKRIALALTAVAGLVVATAAAVPNHQDEWEAQVRRQLQQAGQSFQRDVYSMTHRIYTGSLRNSTSEIVTLELDIGTEYRIMGACDADCSDMDLTLYAPSGAVVSSDVQMDDYPIVSVEPGRTGTYRLKVVMATCTAEPCRYGVGVFGK